MTVTLPPTVARPAPRLRAPLGVAAVGVGVLGYLAVVDPNQPGHYPACPFRALTGLDCPGCGSLRALHSMAHGDVAGALDQNILTVLAVPLLVGLWVGWLRRSRQGLPRQRLAPASLLYGLAGLVVAFAVVRNLPGVPFLGSGIG
jgi:hypothetical protein